MSKNKQQPNWQPISFLPQIAEMIDGMLGSAEENIQNFADIDDRSPVFDDYTVGRMLKVYGEHKRDFWLYDTQLKIWQEGQCQVDPQQATEINRLQGQMKKLKTVVDELLGIAERLKGNTIESVLGKSDLELGLEVLMGKRKL